MGVKPSKCFCFRSHLFGKITNPNMTSHVSKERLWGRKKKRLRQDSRPQTTYNFQKHLLGRKTNAHVAGFWPRKTYKCQKKHVLGWEKKSACGRVLGHKKRVMILEFVLHGFTFVYIHLVRWKHTNRTLY